MKFYFLNSDGEFIDNLVVVKTDDILPVITLFVRNGEPRPKLHNMLMSSDFYQKLISKNITILKEG